MKKKFEFNWTQMVGQRATIEADNIEEAKRQFYNSGTYDVKLSEDRWSEMEPDSVEVKEI